MSPDEFNGVTFEYLLTHQFTNSDDFSVHIETEAKKRNITNYEMIIEYCENSGVDPTSAAKLINRRLKDLIQAEAENLNLMKKKTGKLPL